MVANRPRGIAGDGEGWMRRLLIINVGPLVTFRALTAWRECQIDELRRPSLLIRNLAPFWVARLQSIITLSATMSIP
jgi:hypothetical protein